MTCKNLIAICSKTHQPCPYVNTNGECSEERCQNSVIPTWNEILDIYSAAMKPSHIRLGSVRTGVTALVKVLGSSMSEKITVTPEQLDAAYAKLIADNKSPDTIASYFSHVRACTNTMRREIKMEYRKRGKAIPDIDTPIVKKEIRPVYELSEAQRLAINDEMSRLRTSDKRRDRDRFLWLWFAWRFGVRPIDIERLTWSCIFRHPSGKMWFGYVPQKTEAKCPGRKAGGEILPNEYAEIDPYIGKPEEYIITRYESKAPKNARKHGEYVGRHKTIRAYVIAFMRSVGVPESVITAAYQLRRDCSQQTIKKYGLVKEAQRLGHTPKIAVKHYANLDSIEL